MMIRPFLISLAIVSALHGADLFISPDGNDKHLGTKTKPFATLPHTQKAARAEHAKNPQDGVTVTLLPGRHRLTEPLVFDSADSGTAEAPIVYQSEGDAEISGGTRITDWIVDLDRAGIWKTKVAPPPQLRKPLDRWTSRRSGPHSQLVALQFPPRCH